MAKHSTTEDLVYRDALSGLYNRRYVSERFEPAIARSLALGASVSLLLIDLDHFKEINDTFGHLAGDEAVRRAAEILTENAPHVAMVARYAGDEFIVLLPDTGRFFARMAAEKIANAFRKAPFFEKLGDASQRLTVSIGIASLPEDTANPAGAVDLADRALYAAKRLGRDRTATPDDVPLAESTGEALLACLPCPRAFGRVEELALFTGWLEAAEAKKGRLVLVHGDPGSGKSRYMAECAKLGRERGAVAIEAACSEAGELAPYDAAARILGAYLAREKVSPERLVRGLPEEQAREVSRLLPQIQTLPGSAEEAEAAAKAEGEGVEWDEARRHAVFEGLARAFGRMASGRVLVICLDEAAFIDAASLELLAALAREKWVRLAALLAFSEGDLVNAEGRRRPSGECVLCAEEIPYISTLTLRNLDAPDVTNMISAILPGRPLIASFDRALFALTGGNPLFVEHALQAFIARGVIERREGAFVFNELRDEDIPATLDELLAWQIERLDGETREVLSRAAAADVEVSIDLLKNLTGRSEGEILEIVERLRRSTLAKMQSGGRLRVAGARVRAVSREKLDREDQAEIHRRLAEEASGADAAFDASLARLAFHYSRTGNKSKAQEYLRLARESARKIFNMQEATTYRRVRRSERARRPTTVSLSREAAPLTEGEIARLGAEAAAAGADGDAGRFSEKLSQIAHALASGKATSPQRAACAQVLIRLDRGVARFADEGVLEALSRAFDMATEVEGDMATLRALSRCAAAVARATLRDRKES